MRLTRSQREAIIETFAAHFLPEDKIWLFGSRVDDRKKGGDIDFYIETSYDNALFAAQKQIDFLRDLKKRIGDQKIDVVINLLKDGKKLRIYDEAKETGIQLL